MNDPIVQAFLRRCQPLTEKIRSIFVFGSRAKGTARPDSDYDVLLVVTEAFSLDDKDTLYEAVLDILLETGQLVSLKILKEQTFHQLCEMHTPFTAHVLREGIKVG